MSDVALRVENLSKRYRIGAKQEGYQRFTETMMNTLKAPLQRIKKMGRPVPPDEYIWALKDVSFEVERGEVLGIIGANGAGKSTLLRILSRITTPTEGRAQINGRVGSLLEVGTGFHPELTGRENVYLNGTILGMRRVEVEEKFDEIVEFAGVEKFIDTPVKRYSSGMRVRLAFAVAAHLDPEILLIDEVLAVGDAAFQKKCLGKMGDVAQSGRTILFVSHNMAAIQALCGRAICLACGQIGFIGDSASAIASYVAEAKKRDDSHVRFPVKAADGSLFVKHADVTLDGTDIVIHAEVEVPDPKRAIGLGFEIRDPQDGLVVSQGAIHSGAYVSVLQGNNLLVLRLLDIKSHLNSGDYRFSLWLAHPGGHKYVEIPNLARITLLAGLPRARKRALTLDKNGPLYVSTQFEVSQMRTGESL